MSFTFPADAHPWGQPHTDVEYNGVVFRQFIFLDPVAKLGRTFYATDDRRIYLIAPPLKDVPHRIELDGEPVRRPLGMFLIYDVAALAVDTMHRRDGIHDALESEPDGEET